MRPTRFKRPNDLVITCTPPNSWQPTFGSGGRFRSAAALLLILLYGSALAETPGSPRPRIALINFICDDNSYRSSQAAVDLTAAVQAELTGFTQCEWVERAELEKADDELRLSSFGLMDRAEAIRFGRRVKADWAIFGRVSTNSNAGREMRLEVVDLGHADVLAQSLLRLSPQEGQSFKLDSTGIAGIVESVRGIVAQASQTAAMNRGKPLVAFLFLAPEGVTDAMGDFSQKLRQCLDFEATNSAFHLLHFQRAAVSRDEAEVVLGGFAQDDKDRTQKLADVYLWGSYSTLSGPKFDKVARQFKTETVVQATVNLWDGSTEPRIVTLSVTNAQSDDTLARELARTLAPMLQRTANTTNTEAARQHAADSVLKQAMTLLGRRGHPSLDSVEGRNDWMTLVQMFEVACFFDPLNISAREWANRLRWSNVAGYSSRNEFFFARRRSEAWGKYVDDFRFGAGPVATPSAWGTPDSITKEYVLSAWRPMEMFQYAKENQAQWGVPRDAGRAEVLDWSKRFSKEFTARLLRAPEESAVTARSWEFLQAVLAMNGDQFVLNDGKERNRAVELLWSRIVGLQKARRDSADPSTVQKLALHFQQLGQPGREKVLVEQLEQKVETVSAEAPKSRRAKLPRISELSQAEEGVLFDTPSLSFLLKVTDLPDRPQHFGSQLGIQRIKGAAYHRGKIWLALEVPEPVADAPAEATGDHNLNKVNVDAARLWILDPQAGSLTRATGPLSTNHIISLFSSGDTLWAGSGDAGIISWDTRQNTFQQYTGSEGLSSTNQYGVVAGEAGVFALGGEKGLSWLAPGQSKRVDVPMDPTRGFNLPHIGEARQLALSAKNLLLFSQGLICKNLQSNQWVRIDQSITAALGPAGLGRVTQMIGDGQGGFWVGSDSGLYFVDAETGSLRSQLLLQSFSLAPLPRLQLPPGMVVPQALQAQSREGEVDQLLSRVLDLRHRWTCSVKTNPAAPNVFKPTSRLPGAPVALASDGDLLWVLSAEAHTPFSFCLMLYDPAKHEWIKNSAVIHGERPYLLTGAGKAWVISASPQQMELHSFDRKQWLNISQRISDEVGAEEPAAFVSKLSPGQEAVWRIFWGEPDRAIRLLSELINFDPNPESLFLLSLAHDPDGLNHPEEQRKFLQRLMEDFPESAFARYLSNKQKLSAIQARAAERRAAGAGPPGAAGFYGTNRLAVAAQRAAALLRDYDSDGDGKLSLAEMALAFENEPERLPISPVRFDPQNPLESTRRLANFWGAGGDGSLDSRVLQRAFISRPIKNDLPSREGTPLGRSPASAGSQPQSPTPQ